MTKIELRLQCLQLALNFNKPHEDTIKIAKDFFEFVFNIEGTSEDISAIREAVKKISRF